MIHIRLVSIVFSHRLTNGCLLVFHISLKTELFRLNYQVIDYDHENFREYFEITIDFDYFKTETIFSWEEKTTKFHGK